MTWRWRPQIRLLSKRRNQKLLLSRHSNPKQKVNFYHFFLARFPSYFLISFILGKPKGGKQPPKEPKEPKVTKEGKDEKEDDGNACSFFVNLCVIYLSSRGCQETCNQDCLQAAESSQGTFHTIFLLLSFDHYQVDNAVSFRILFKYSFIFCALIITYIFFITGNSGLRSSADGHS